MAREELHHMAILISRVRLDTSKMITFLYSRIMVHALEFPLLRDKWTLQKKMLAC